MLLIIITTVSVAISAQAILIQAFVAQAMLPSLVFASMPLIHIKALRMMHDTVTIDVLPTATLDTVYNATRNISRWPFGPELCVSDIYGRQLYRGKH